MDKTFLIFGDSIAYASEDLISGWVQRLTEFIGKKNLSGEDYYCVYNLAVHGNTTEDLLERFESETKQRFDEKEDAVIVFAIGINDSQFIHSQNGIRISVEKTEENIKKLANLARHFTSNIVFVGLTPVDETKTTPIPWNTDKSFKNEYIKKYNEIIKDTCAQSGVHFIDIFNEWAGSDYKNLLEDGLHPNSEGHKKIFETVKDFLIDKKII